MVEPIIRPKRCPECDVISRGSSPQCDCGFVFATGARVVTRARAAREFDLRQQAGAGFIGLFVGGVIGPALLVVDSNRPYRGVFMIVIGLLMIAASLPAWLELPRSQRSLKALASRRGRGQSAP